MPESTVEMRKCKRCQTEKELTKANFAPRKFKDTHYFDGICRACWNSYRKRWMRENRSRYAEKEADWYAKNRDKILATQRDLYSKISPEIRAAKIARARLLRASQERKKAINALAKKKYYADVEKSRNYAKEFARAWRKKNLVKSRLSAHKGRARRRGAKIETITQKQIEDLFAKQRGRCAICTSKIDIETKHIDHIVAIAKGGKHEILNLQLTCPRCNMSKHDKHPIDYMQKLGFLL